MAPSIPNDIYQYSLQSAYRAGLKEGGPPVAFLTNHGTHGLGIFEAEEEDSDSNTNPQQSRPNDMIQIDSTAYSLDSDGVATPAGRGDTMPFTMVTVFSPAQRAKPPVRTTKDQVQALFQRNGKNTPMPFRVTGTFKYINTQQRTYWDVSGTVFGFCIPSWQKDVSGDGLQCGFLSQDKKSGGRVVDFETGDGAVVEWAKCGRFHLGFPQDEEYEELRL